MLSNNNASHLSQHTSQSKNRRKRIPSRPGGVSNTYPPLAYQTDSNELGHLAEDTRHIKYIHSISRGNFCLVNQSEMNVSELSNKLTEQSVHDDMNDAQNTCPTTTGNISEIKYSPNVKCLTLRNDSCAFQSDFIVNFAFVVLNTKLRYIVCNLRTKLSKLYRLWSIVWLYYALAHALITNLRQEVVMKKLKRTSVIVWCAIFSQLPISSEAFCAPGCTCDDIVLSIRCTNASLSVIPYLLNPEVKYLKLLCNNIENVGQSLAFYPQLTTLDLGHNILTSLEGSDFGAQKKLTTLRLNNNNLTKVKKENFRELSQLMELHIHNNQITSLDPESFVGLGLLTVLDLSNNKLKTISEDTLKPLVSLERLYINYNDFQHAPSNALRNLPSLRQLQLNGNELSDVPPRAFYNLRNLLTINIDKNRIGLIAPDAFAGLGKLTFLSLVDNRLPYIPGHSFQNLGNLTGLDISGNRFQTVDKRSFPSLPNLTHLRLGRCPRLTWIGPEAFVRTPAIESLELNQNTRLAYIDEKSLSSLLNLKELDLTACGLVFIHPTQISRAHTTKLRLAGNPLHCNCSLLWLARLPLNGSIILDSPTCATPPKFYGIAVRNIDLQEAGCNFSLGWTTIATCVGVVLVGLLIIALFLASRGRCRKPAVPCKALPGELGPRSLHLPPQFPPPPPFNSPSSYAPKIPLPSPPTFSPSVRPLLPPPAPSPTHQALLPADWLFPSPYDDDTHWYTTVGRDGREYLTGDLPPPSARPPVPPPPSGRLKRSSSSSSRPSPALSNRKTHEKRITKAEGPPLDSRGLPITYI